MAYPNVVPEYVMNYYKSMPCVPLAVLVDKNTFAYKTTVLKVVVTVSPVRVPSPYANLFTLNETNKNYGFKFFTAIGTMRDLQNHFSSELNGKRCRTPLGLLNALNAYYSNSLKSFDFTIIVYDVS